MLCKYYILFNRIIQTELRILRNENENHFLHNSLCIHWKLKIPRLIVLFWNKCFCLCRWLVVTVFVLASFRWIQNAYAMENNNAKQFAQLFAFTNWKWCSFQVVYEWIEIVEWIPPLIKRHTIDDSQFWNIFTLRSLCRSLCSIRVRLVVRLEYNWIW